MTKPTIAQRQSTRTSIIYFSTMMLFILVLWPGCHDHQEASLIEQSEPTYDFSSSDMLVDWEAPFSTHPRRIRLSLGEVEGHIEESAVGPTISFKGIPYAQPPVGELRLQPPQAISPWEGVFSADVFGPICPQGGILTDDEAPQSEDCLSLNIWGPVDETGQSLIKDKALPVMVWIHGGGFIQGSGRFRLYNGARMAARGQVVVVTLNYRLGLLGFLNTRRLAIERDGQDELSHARQVGNFGIQDQLLALSWIKSHIGDFGGNPENITIFGESAGGFSICALLSSPLSDELFERAIIQSGGGCDGFEALGDRGESITQTEAERKASDILNAFGCTDLVGEQLHSCLRTLPVSDFLDRASVAGESALGLPLLGPVTDGGLIQGRLDQLVREGKVNVPDLIIGSNADEMTLFTYNLPINLAFYQQTVNAFFGSLADRIFELYPAEDRLEAREAYNQLVGDIIFVCPTLKLASRLSQLDQTNNQKIWVYHFVHSLSNGFPSLLGATHGLEIPFVFNNSHIELFGSTANPEDERLSEQMSDTWIQFARYGEPESTEVSWPVYRSSLSDDEENVINRGQVMLWKVNPEVTGMPLKEGRCQVLNELGLLIGAE